MQRSRLDRWTTKQKTYQDICMTKLFTLSALPLLHYRESYERPKSELQRLCILIVTFCSIPRSRSLMVTPVRPWRSFHIAPGFLVAPYPLSSLLSSSSSSLSTRRCCCCCCCMFLCFLLFAVSCLVYESTHQKLG